MSNEPIFQKLAREYAMRGKSYERMVTPYLSPVKPLGTKQPLMDTPVYAPDPHLDGPFREPLPKRTVSPLFQVPEPDPEFTKKFQDFISTAPLQLLQGTPAGSFINNIQPVRTEDGGITLEAEVMVPHPQIVEDQMEAHYGDTSTLMMRALQGKASRLRGGIPKLAIVDEMQRFQETGELDQTTIDPEAVNQTHEPISYIELAEVIEKVGNAVVLTKTITMEEILDGKTSVDVIQELGREIAEKHPGAEVLEVNVDENHGDVIVTVRGTLISEKGNASTPNNPEQTDESVNAASNEETDEDDEPVILAPDFWKIRDEE